MGLIDIAIGVLGGNLLTAMFIYGAVRFTQDEQRGEWSWYYWGCIAFPLAMLIMGALSTGWLPPFLDVVTAQ